MKVLAVLATISGAVLAVSGCALDDSPSVVEGSSSSPSSTQTPDPDFRMLQQLRGDAPAGEPASARGYLRIQITKNGLCGVLSSGIEHTNQGQGFIWPNGYRVVKEPWGTSVLDARGRWIADDGDFLYVRGSEVDGSSVEQRCPHRAGSDLIVRRVSEPGTPLGAKNRPVALLDCQGMPQVRPRSIELGCSSGNTLSRVKYHAWSRDGAAGTAMASGTCSTMKGFGPVPISFTYERVSEYHGLLILRRLDLRYDRGDPCG